MVPRSAATANALTRITFKTQITIAETAATRHPHHLNAILHAILDIHSAAMVNA